MSTVIPTTFVEFVTATENMGKSLGLTTSETALRVESLVCTRVVVLVRHASGAYPNDFVQLVGRQAREAAEAPADDVSAHNKVFVAAVSRYAAHVLDQPSLIVSVW